MKNELVIADQIKSEKEKIVSKVEKQLELKNITKLLLLNKELLSVKEGFEKTIKNIEGEANKRAWDEFYAIEEGILNNHSQYYNLCEVKGEISRLEKMTRNLINNIDLEKDIEDSVLNEIEEQLKTFNKIDLAAAEEEEVEI